MNKPRLWMMCIACAALGACGGGGDGGGVAVAESHEVPAAASQSVQANVGWLGQLTAENSETKEALDLAKYAPPSAEDTEPMAVQ